VDAKLIAALAEPNRLRMVELLSAAPRPVGEIASALGLRQPQVSKHLQTLERAGLVIVYPLAQRRIYALQREPLRALRVWLDELHADRPSEAALERYGAAIAEEHLRSETDPAWAAGRSIRLRRTLPGPIGTVWRYWTSADRIRRWWSPEHFVVVEAVADPVPDGRLRIVMAEGDGTRHVAVGHYLALSPPNSLSFALAPVGPLGTTLFAATHTVRLNRHGRRTALSLTIRVTDLAPAAITAVAGLRLGWSQLLDKLARELKQLCSDAQAAASP
jgi:uncharacterized protein YndB with AHSA1/START domain/DNA-binding transcriptional ArsR family regulator